MRAKGMSIVIAIALVLIAGCDHGTQATPTATIRPLPTTPTLAPPTATSQAPQATETPRPTATSTPRPTPAPTDIPTPSATPTPAVVITPIGAISAAQSGQEATVEGRVVGTASFSAGFKFTLDDGTGQITLLMWHNVYDDCWDAPEINLGATVRATGEIGEYEGELQIAPDFGGDVKAIESASAWATPRDIGTLTGGDAGQRVMIEGQVIRVEGLSSAVKVFVRDASGEIVVFIWRNVLDRIPNNAGLGTPGSRVRVVGAVEVYRDNLEVTPALPYDVTVLEIAPEGGE